ncbi:hyaluronoglucosaminidase [Streptomyces sp. CB02400]|uniref:hyaluronoglucosaminidase n=2 Tax=unclassified Streptomyces TaxID=2593676 RepID=UPI00093CCC36|nr:hyaluronoglucosaminidase [Streptomyces sp. CB02400]OKK13618.1 hyaluronoglucosaminidase [Streptomyces sp. CB02400]
MTVGRRVFLGAFTAGAVTVATGSEAAAAAEDAYTPYTSPASFWGDSPTEHVVTINYKATTGDRAALNVTSVNPVSSAMYITGHEQGQRGTLKIAHVGYADGSDPGASGLSIDLKTQGTAAQGIFVTATDGPTKGALIILRNNPDVDDFVVKGNGLTGINVSRGDAPQSQLHVVQGADAESAILAEGALRLADVDSVPTNAPAAAGGGSLYAQGGKLFWKGGDGKPVPLA